MKKEDKKLTKQELQKLTGGDAIESILSSHGNGSKGDCHKFNCGYGCSKECKNGCVESCITNKHGAVSEI